MTVGPRATPPRDPVPAYRLYSDAAGQSHIERFEFRPTQSGSSPQLASVPWVGAQAVTFVRGGQSLDMEWHSTPRRMLIVVVSGEVEFRASDGDAVTCAPGSVMLAEDLEGVGHATRSTAAEDVLFAFIHVADDWRPQTAPEGVTA